MPRRSVHVLAKCLHGRREGWTSVFASDASAALDDGLPLPDDVDGDDDADEDEPPPNGPPGGLDRRAGFAGLGTSSTLVVSRATPQGAERLAPSYALRGLLPAALLQTHRFWYYALPRRNQTRVDASWIV